MTRSYVVRILIVLFIPISLELINFFFLNLRYEKIQFGGFYSNLNYYVLISSLLVISISTVLLSLILFSKCIFTNLITVLAGMLVHVSYLFFVNDFFFDYALIGKVYILSLLVSVLQFYIFVIIFKKKKESRNNESILDNDKLKY